MRDFKRRLRYYKSDFTDGLNVNCLAASIVLYFAVFFPNVAFGGLLAEKTDNWLGVSEVIFATCLSGILFGLFSGQPLIIVGATGPVLVFEQTVYKVNMAASGISSTQTFRPFTHTIFAATLWTITLPLLPLI